MACAVQTQATCQAKGQVVEAGWDWTDECAHACSRGTYYASATVVRPPAISLTGFEYVAQNAGQTGIDEPDWPSYALTGATFRDGAVMWVAQPASAASLLKTIVSSTWSASDPSVTIAGTGLFNTIDQQTVAQMAGSTVSPVGTTYAVTNTVTFSDGTNGVGVFNLTIE